MPDSTVTASSFQEELRRELSASVPTVEPSPFEDFHPSAVAWLAMVPAWPVSLVEDAFPFGADRSVDILDRFWKEGLCEIRRGLPLPEREGELEYFMNDTQKAAARRYLLSRNFSSISLPAVCAECAEKIEAAARDKEDRQESDYMPVELLVSYSDEHDEEREARREYFRNLPAVVLDERLQRWTTLAHLALDAPALAVNFLQKVDDSLRLAEEQNARAVPVAARWIETAEDLAAWLPGPLEAALVTARRHREFFLRRVYDRRHLAHYFNRPPLDKAFHKWLNGPDDRWALHFVGDGGAGKTMFLRHIAQDARPETGLVMARIDFDLLNPDYPLRAPALFLDRLANDLRLYENAGFRLDSSAFADFDQQATQLDERSGANVDAVSAQFAVSEAALNNLVDSFCDTVSDISFNRQVLLVLDTCEELARIRPDGTLPPSVEATFRVLEKIHDRLPGVRVMFSGRRPLASRGAGWHWTGAQGVHALPERPYLCLTEVQGFSREEALSFLDGYVLREEVSARVNRGLFELILRYSRTAAGQGERRFVCDGEPPDAPLEETYNPYDLDLFASWSCEDPELDEAKLRDGGALVYVRERILRRLSAGLRRRAGAVVVAGRFDQPILETLLGGTAEENAGLIDELTNERWIDLDRGSSQQNPVWFVTPMKHTRLWKYFREEEAERPALARACQTVAETFEPLTLRRPWNELTSGYFEAVLRAWHERPEMAARWWVWVEQRIAADAEWEWARSLTELLLAEESEISRGVTASRQLRGTIVALRAAVCTHLTPGEAGSIWIEVQQTAGRYPITAERERLLLRARMGRLAGELRAGEMPPHDQLLEQFREIQTDLARWVGSEPPRLLRLQMLASHTALFDSLLEWNGRLPSALALSPSLQTELCGMVKAISEQWRAAGAMVEELELYRGSLEKRLARPALQSSEKVTADISVMLVWRPVLPTQHWLDWRKPEDVAARIQLGVLHDAWTQGFLTSDLSSFLQPWPKAQFWEPWTNTIDGDRLASARLTLLGAAEVPGRLTGLRESIEPSLARPLFPPLCNAHRAFPPSVVAAIEAVGMAGRLPESVDLLQEIGRKASGETRFEWQRAADRAGMRLALHFQHTDEPGVNVGGSLFQSDDFEDLSLRAMLAVIEGDRSTDAIRNRLPFVRQRNEDRTNEIDRLSWLLGGNDHPSEVYQQLGGANTTGGERLLRTQIAEAEHPLEKFRLSLLAVALGMEKTIDASLVARIGERRAADLALVEGMLLARRCGAARGVALLALASEWFLHCVDFVGRFLADLQLAMAHTETGTAVEPDALKKSYEACRARFESLPPWYVLTATAEPTDGSESAAKAKTEALDALAAYSYWRPCLVRTVGVLVCGRELNGQAAAGELVRAWITKTYSTQRENQTHFAPDLARWVPTGAMSAKPRSARDTLVGIAGCLVGIGLLTLFGFFAWKAALWFRTNWQQMSGTTSVLTSQIAGGVILSTFVLLCIQQRKALLSGLMSLFPAVMRPFTLRMRVAPKEVPADPRRPLQSPLTYHLESQFALFSWQITKPQPVVPGTLSTATTDRTGYEEIVASLPASIVARLDEYGGRLRRGGYHLRLQIDDTLAGVAWEAAINNAAQKSAGRSRPTFHCRRTLTIAESARLSPLLSPISVAVYASNSYLGRFANLVWHYPVDGPGFVVEAANFTTSDAAPASGPSGRSDYGIIHLFGTPQETNLGVVLDLSSNGSGNKETLNPVWDAGQVLRTARNVQLCIVQAPLDVNIGQRDRKRRQEANLLRRFGAAVCKTGVPAVLVLPPLTEALLGRVFEVIRPVLSPAAPVTRRGEWHWLRMLRRVQDVVAESLEPTESATGEAPPAAKAEKEADGHGGMPEAVFDVCLYLVDEFVWEVESAPDPKPVSQ